MLSERGPETEGGGDGPSIRFRLDPRVGVPAYRQLMDQVRHAVQLGILSAGDRLPSVREVVTQITINPNTVHRAYRELEAAGIAEGRAGLGTFVVDGGTVALRAAPEQRDELLGTLRQWVASARGAGLDDGAIEALMAAATAEPPRGNGSASSRIDTRKDDR